MKSDIDFTEPPARRMARDILELAAVDPTRAVEAQALASRGWTGDQIRRYGQDARALAANSPLGRRFASAQAAA